MHPQISQITHNSQSEQSVKSVVKLLSSSTAAADLVIDDPFEDPIETHFRAEADELAHLRDIRNAARHVFESLFVSLVIWHKDDFGIGFRDLFDALGKLEN